MEDEIIDFERMSNYWYNGMNDYLEIYYLEESDVKVFVYFQVDVDHETDESPGMGDHIYDKDDAIRNAIKQLHTQYS